MGVTIEFLANPDLFSRIPRPYPANQLLPNWLKAMPMDRPSPTEPGAMDRTIKRCPPFLEAMTAGYIIPLPCDCHFAVDSRGQFTAQSQHPLVSSHDHAQYQGAPFEKKLVLKFRNLWIVRTPPGYSCLFTAPFNRFEIPFTPLTGIVETDTYYNEVNVPTLCHLTANTSVTLTAGTPIFQVIPFQREAWESGFATRDEATFAASSQEFRDNVHAYKERYWRKHTYT
jgi:hypothetical protein